MVNCPSAGYNATVMVRQDTVSKRPTQAIILVILVLILLLAYALRLVNLEAFSFWTDEGLTPLRSGYDLLEIVSNRIIIQDGVTKDTHPPLYYLIIHFTRQMFGESDFAYRYPSLLAGVLLVPLLYQFARRLQSNLAGLFAALLVAVNPLQIYYGNEARMYTIVVLLAAAASYVLWRALSGADLRRSLLLYGLLAGLALYTHYTAVFLIAVQAFFWIWLLWREGHKRLIAGLGIAALLLAIPVVPYTVPRLFTGAEANYFYVAPGIMLGDVLRFFTLGLTVDFNEFVVSVLLLGTFLLALIGFWSAGSWLKRLFLLAYLLAVVFGLMAGSLIKPMYQGVRHIMIGSPALLLLLAMGADFLMQRNRLSANGQRAAVRFAGLLLLLAPLVGSIYALDNLYNDPAYAKDDLRGLVRYVEWRAGENDVVLYNNAVLLPLHAHYQTREDLSLTALPVYPHTADGVEAQTADLAARFDRIWFVTDPPADDRDADGRVQSWLDENLQDIDNRSFHARTTVVHSTGYRTAPSLVEQAPPDSAPLAFAWPGLPTLAAGKIASAEPAGGETLWLDLFWQGDFAASLEGTALQLRLQGADGRSWAENQQSLSDNFDNWPAAKRLVRESYKLPLHAETPAGTYTLMAQPLDREGIALGEAQPLAEVQLAPSPAVPGRPAVAFENGLALQRIDWYDDSVHPGHNMSFALIWQAAAGASPQLDDVRYEMQVIDANGDVLRTVLGRPVDGALDQLPAGTAARETAAIYFPPEAQPGKYELWWRLYAGDELVSGRPSWRPWASDRLIYGELTVAPWPMETELPPEAIPVEAQYGPAIQLAAYQMGEVSAAALPLTLYWLATEKPDKELSGFCPPGQRRQR